MSATQRMAWFAGAFAALAIGASTANAGSNDVLVPHATAGDTRVAATMVSPPPRLHRHMEWFRRHSTARSLQAQTEQFGSTAVIGLESMRDFSSLQKRYGFDHVRLIPELRAAQVRVDAEQLHALLANELTDRRVRYVSPLGPPRRPMGMPSDPLVRTIDAWSNLPYEWQFAAARVDRALDLSKGDPAITVGVIDTGVAEVPDLSGKVDSRWSFAENGALVPDMSPEGNDVCGHGTAVASLIAANVDDGFGMAGFGGAAHVIAVRAGNCVAFYDNAIAIALTKLVSLGVRVVNMSVGGRLPSEPILVDAIHKAAAAGVLLVASTGNEGDSYVSWPAADLQPSGGMRSFGVAVGASNAEGTRAYFSNSGSHISVVAPGSFGGICSGVLVALAPTNEFNECYSMWTGDGGARYGYIDGTSFSAPEVAGIAALIWAARPELKNYQVADIIKQSARRNTAIGWTPALGCGLIDAGAALELATGVGSAEGLESDVPCSAAGIQPPTWPSESSQTITFEPIESKVLGDPDFEVRATASSGLPVTFAAGGNCTVTGSTVHLTRAGSCSITASQGGDGNHNPAANVSRSFDIEDVPARTVRALATSGKWGASVNLPFWVGEGNGDVAVKITVQKNRATVARLARDFFRVESGHVYALAWRAPKAKTKAAYRFCVTLSDRAGRETAPSCGRIRLR